MIKIPLTAKIAAYAAQVRCAIVQAVANASTDQPTEIHGIERNLAKAIHSALN